MATTSTPQFPGVFVAGDMGQARPLVIVWAIAEGRAAAAYVDRARVPVPCRRLLSRPLHPLQ